MQNESREDRIRARAYELWLADGGAHGNDLSYWLMAEKQFQEEQAQAAESALPAAHAPPTKDSTGKRPTQKKAPSKSVGAKAAGAKTVAAKAAGAKKPVVKKESARTPSKTGN